MCAAGCKYHSLSRVESKERLANVLDPAHYDHDIKFDPVRRCRVLNGGHEHYNEQHKRTRIVVVHFYCVRRPTLSKEERQKQMAARLVGLAAQAAKEDEANPVFDPDEDIWDDTAIEDDSDYTGGNDLYNPASHFIYRCNVVCVEAIDCVHANEALEPVVQAPAPPTRTRVIFDGSEDDAPAQQAQEPAAPSADPSVVPDGLGALSLDSAGVLTGKYRAATFIANAQAKHPLFPLCIRAFQFSVGEGVT